MNYEKMFNVINKENSSKQNSRVRQISIERQKSVNNVDCSKVSRNSRQCKRHYARRMFGLSASKVVYFKRALFNVL